MAISEAHMQLLTSSAITPEVIEASGIHSTETSLAFPWSDGTGPTVWQYRPDQPKLDDDGKPMKYVFPKGSVVPFNCLRPAGESARIIIAEGTKQQYAVASYAPEDFGILGMSGCWGWRNADLSPVLHHDVYVILDADFSTNADVYVAAEQMQTALKRGGAKSVQFVSTSGTDKQGIDDVLAAMPEGRRSEMLKVWLAQAAPKLGKRPKAKQPKGVDGGEGPEKYFRKREAAISLQPKDVADDILAQAPAAITPEENIALYSNGVYVVDANAVLSKIVDIFGNYYTPSIRTTVTEVLKGNLFRDGQILPERMDKPLLNCANTMVDLRTGETLPHSPDYLSSVQVSVDYEPEAPAPVYVKWLREALRQPHHTEADLDALVDGVEEICGTMLDPSRTPSKALFLFGPSRSGKSTLLRLLRAVAGSRNTSAVTLHDLSSDVFAGANLYGKMLNVAADLSNKHVNDLSLFKMVLGDDVIRGNRKYGKDFSFTNQALMAFSANELPTVSEASRAYTERVWPVNFPNSFAGREDKTLEDKLMAELPGILARWIEAYGRMLARGGYGAQDHATQREFESKSDRVVQFFQDMCTVQDANHGQTIPDGLGCKRRDVAKSFNEWAKRNGSSEMGERAFFQRFANITGVTEVRMGAGRSRSYNVIVARADDDAWDEDQAPSVPLEPVGAPLLAVPPSVELTVHAEAQATLKAPSTASVNGVAVDPWADGLDLHYEM